MVINRNQNPINTIINYLRNSANGSGDSWNSSSHGFKNAHGEPLVFGGEAVHRGTLKELFAFCARDPAVELAAVGNTELCRKRFIFSTSPSPPNTTLVPGKRDRISLDARKSTSGLLFASRRPKKRRLDANKVSTAGLEL